MTLEQIPLIPLEVLFGHPEYASVRISPDGRFVAYLRPWAGGQRSEQGGCSM